MKSHGVYRARADLQKCGFCEEKLAGSVKVLVKLQRPPPDIRIFLPALLEWSMSSTWRPRAAAVRAHSRPAAPAPMITTSEELTTSSGKTDRGSIPAPQGRAASSPATSRVRVP